MDETTEFNRILAHASGRDATGAGRYSNGPGHFAHPEAPHMNANRPAGTELPPAAPPSFDLWTFIELIVRRWYWMLLGGCLLALGGYFAGQYFFQPGYLATAELLRFETANTTEYYKPRQFAQDTFASVIRSPELLQQVSRIAQPPLSVDDLDGALTITPSQNSDMLSITMAAPHPQMAVDLANLYAREAVRYSQELQRKEASGVDNILKEQLSQMDLDIQDLSGQLRSLPKQSLEQPSATRTQQLADKLQTAREELITLLSRYTEAHPAVIEQRAKIKMLETQLQDLIAKGAQNPGAGAGADKNKIPDDLDVLRSQITAIANNHLLLVQREREARQFVENPPGYCRIFSTAAVKDVASNGWKKKVLFLAVFGGLVGVGGAALMVLMIEVMDERLKNAEDIKRVTGLPLVATLGDIHRMSPKAQSNWAFRTWTSLQSRLSPTPNHGLVCGVTSCNAGEGRSTWVNLLAQAASQCGFRVLTIGTVRMPEPEEPAPEANAEPAPANGSPAPAADSAQSQALTTNVLASPAQVTNKLIGQDPQPFVHIPLPGWVWNLDRRKQWQGALVQWRKIENVVILVELPPASMSETVLLATNLPNLIWLSRSGWAGARETRAALKTLCDARCHLVGCALNDEAAPPMKQRFARWFACGLIGLGLGVSTANAAIGPADPLPAPALLAPSPIAENLVAETNPPALPAISITNFSFSAFDSSHRADWQKRLTLGPGDILSFSLFGSPELDRREVPIGPDGRISYLQAVDVMATGLTVDELRDRFDQELAKYYRTPRTIITPVAYQSKKYYVLGKVVNRGVFTLQHPVSIIEAVARAKGLETGLLDNQNVTETADLQRSFLMRRGKYLPVNFERLFQEGDLSQNIPLEPDDYLYFAASTLSELYVLGEVRTPGPLTYTTNLTVVAAIARSGGFNEHAYKSRVLVVRGSLRRPQKFVVDAWGTLEGRVPDFHLEPRDIVYVHSRPFVYAEDLLDFAATAFVQSVITSWTGKHIDPIITSPIFP